jgi:Fic family protein
LAGVVRQLPNPKLFVRPFVRREAVLSSRIEGTTTSVEQLVLFEAGDTRRVEVDDATEVRNYVHALDYGMERLKTFPLSLRLMRELHERLLQGTRGENRRPGEFRRLQNHIRGRGLSPEDARFVPPPVPQMHEALGDLERFLTEHRELPPLVHMALVHYQFEAIHPFEDGNGRIGRLLAALMFSVPDFYQREPLLPQPMLYLSAFFEKNRETYYDHLLAVSQRGLWGEWVGLFLRAVAEQSNDAVRRAQKLLELRHEYQEKVRTARVSALLSRLVDELFAGPALSAMAVRKALGVTHFTALDNLRKLEKLGIVKEGTGNKRYQLFIAWDILHLLEDA